LCDIQITWVAQFIEIVRTRADHPPCQPTIATQLLLDGGKIEPYTIIIMIPPIPPHQFVIFTPLHWDSLTGTRVPAHFFNFLNYYYILLLDDGSISVRNVGIKPENEFTQICGYADVPDVSEPGALTVHFPGSPGGNYWVIGTDYENYASIYSCKSFLVFSLEYSWVLVRDPANVTPEIKEAALKAFTDNGLSLDKFEDTVQSNCTYEDPNVPPCKTED
jgi:hypothetical protein